MLAPIPFAHILATTNSIGPFRSNMSKDDLVAAFTDDVRVLSPGMPDVDAAIRALLTYETTGLGAGMDEVGTFCEAFIAGTGAPGDPASYGPGDDLYGAALAVAEAIQIGPIELDR